MSSLPAVDPAFLDISASLDGFTVWLGDERHVEVRTWAEACAAYTATLALAETANGQLNNILRRV